MKKFILIAIAMFSVAAVYSQKSYTRNSLTTIYLDYQEGRYNSQLSNYVIQLPIPDKFDDNTVHTREIRAGFSRPDIAEDPLGYKKTHNALPGLIQAGLEAEKVGNQIMAKWYNRQSDGSMDMSVIQQRGLYTVTDSDVITASASKKGDAVLKDMGEKLLTSSYIMVVDIYDVESTDEEDRRGFTSNANGYLYKLIFNDSVVATIYNTLWVNATDDASVKAERKRLFDETNFTLDFVMSTKLTATYVSSKDLTHNELLQQLAEKTRDNLVRNFENKVPKLNVKAGITSPKPIGAKIGKKEGLIVDHRYFVMETRQRNDGEEYDKRRGVVRAKLVKDNRYVAEGKTDTSFFYQTAGKKVDHYSMFLTQKNDFGIGIMPTFSVGEMSGFGGRAEYNLSGLFAKALNKGKFPTSFKVIADVAYQSKAYSLLELPPEYFSFLRFDFGFAKDQYFMRNFHAGVFAGFGIEMASWESAVDSESLMTYLVNGGAKLGVNMMHNVQLVGMATYNLPFLDAVYTDESGEKVDLDQPYTWTDLFEGRKGLMLTLGLRIQL